MPVLAYVLGTAHSGVGILSLLMPASTIELFGMNPSKSTNFVGRLFGCRDLLLGAGLLRSLYQSSRVEYIQLLTIINIMNAVDTISGLIEYYQGNLSPKALFWGSGGAFFLCCIGMAQILA